MRTTLDIANDVLQAAKEIAARERSTAGIVISRLAREGLRHPDQRAPKIKNGVPVFAARDGEIVTVDHIRKLADDEGI